MNQDPPSRLAALWHRLGDERGDVAIIEVLLWIPIVVLLLGLLAVALRQSSTEALAQDAAEAAARAASRASDPETGERMAHQSLDATLAGHPGACDAVVDTSTWNNGQVHVEVTCATNLGSLERLTSGDHTVTRAWTETVDNARIARTGPDT
jgi:Flp pilus assembly protein TadG